MVTGLWLAQLALFASGWLVPWRHSQARKDKGRLPIPVRMLLSFSLVVAAGLIWAGHWSKVAAYADWVLLGMIASFIGDVIMARLIPVPNRLIGGMVAFGAAHALYVSAFVNTIQTISSLVPYQRWSLGLTVGLVLYGLLAVGSWWFVIRNPAKGRGLNLGALVYGLWIGVMASNALALAVALGGGFWLAALGGLLFVSSDLIVGMTDIRGIQFKHSNDWVWLTYIAAQMGIVYAGAV